MGAFNKVVAEEKAEELQARACNLPSISLQSDHCGLVSVALQAASEDDDSNNELLPKGYVTVGVDDYAAPWTWDKFCGERAVAPSHAQEAHAHAANTEDESTRARAEDDAKRLAIVSGAIVIAAHELVLKFAS